MYKGLTLTRWHTVVQYSSVHFYRYMYAALLVKVQNDDDIQVGAKK